MVIGIGGIFVDSGLIEIGVVAAFVLYLNNLFEPVQQLGQLYNTLQAAAAALHKLFSLLDTPASIASRSDAIDLPKSGTLCVKNVSFGYGEGADVLHDVSIEISPGERIALVGPTGAGKSTLAKLLARFYDPREGVVSFGGVDLRDTTVASLRERIVVVPQEAHLFAGTIRENIRVGKPEATDEEIEGSLDALGIRERLSALGVGHGPSGLDLEVRERGSRLSAGERQLVSLARAALADPPVLVLDEATSNLDPGTESEVERALEVLTKNRTVIVVAHRLSTAERADRVAVVDDGRIVELGTHSDLAAASGRYASLWLRWTFDHSSAAPAS
jgi:ATP-binding cassette subfamily B protein